VWIVAGYKSSDTEGLRKAKSAALIQLLSSATFDVALVLCKNDEYAPWLVALLQNAGMNAAVAGDLEDGQPGDHHAACSLTLM
jgi:ribosomal protein S12 methylthiotransferase accessory factor YcaO